MIKKGLIKKAKIRAAKLRKLREDDRCKTVMGRLKQENLLVIDGVTPNKRKLFLDDIIWVGENIEPRVLELLPAIALKKPSVFIGKEFPEDLKQCMNDLKNGRSNTKYRGIPIEKLEYWVPRVGRNKKYPSTTKTFRFTRSDLDLLKELSDASGLSESDVIREGLRILKSG